MSKKHQQVLDLTILSFLPPLSVAHPKGLIKPHAKKWISHQERILYPLISLLPNEPNGNIKASKPYGPNLKTTKDAPQLYLEKPAYSKQWYDHLLNLLGIATIQVQSGQTVSKSLQQRIQLLEINFFLLGRSTDIVLSWRATHTLIVENRNYRNRFTWSRRRIVKIKRKKWERIQ